MRSKIRIGVAFIALGLLAALGPTALFPVCDSGMMKMACHDTARAELWVGLAIAALGAAYALTRPAKIRIGLAAASGLGGALAVLLPTALTGVCKNADMICHSLTLPALVILGAATVALGAAGIALSARAARKG
jgi:hypothetical protein